MGRSRRRQRRCSARPRSPVREVLELGSGGRYNAVHLKARFAMALVDAAEQMLAVCRRLNPECERGRYAHCAALSALDGVFIHDAGDSMTTECANGSHGRGVRRRSGTAT
jgi:hypothetical protein